MNFWKISSILPLALFVACTDYVGQVDDQIENLREQQASVSSTSSEETQPSSSNDAKPADGSSSSEEANSDPEESSSSAYTEVSCPVVEPRVRDSLSKVVVRFMPSWSNTSAVMVVDGQETIMTAVRDYCGWFQATVTAPASGFSAVFKQTIGNVYREPVSLDSIAALGDMLWIVDNPDGEPGLYTCFPERLGECPVRTVSVQMFDWLHGNYGDGKSSGSGAEKVWLGGGNASKDSIFNDNRYLISNDFGSGGCQSTGGRGMLGMVEQRLGENGVPKRNDVSFPAACSGTDYLDYWFLPLEIGQDAAGKKYTNSTCRSLELSLTDDGYWLAQKNSQSPERGLFFLDDFEYLDSAKTVKNIFFDRLSGSGGYHNFGFTMKFQAKFEYVPGQKFEFKGDDDVWVFINNRLVVDIGGTHAEVSGAVDLDTLGLTEGKEYPFHIFYAERHTSSSNFMMRTTIDLKSSQQEGGCL